MTTEPLSLDGLRAEGDPNSSAPAGTDVGHVHLEVSSIEASRRFYVDALGLRRRQVYGDQALFLAAGDYHHHVGINVWNGRSDPATGRGLDWFELRVPSTEALAAARSRLDAAGHPITDHQNGLSVTDPDGIEVRLTATE